MIETPCLSQFQHPISVFDEHEIEWVQLLGIHKQVKNSSEVKYGCLEEFLHPYSLGLFIFLYLHQQMLAITPHVITFYL